MIDEGKLPLWTSKIAPKIAKEYYGLDDSAKMRDVLLNVRADEAIHRSVNHYFSDIP
jgi:ubiquinol oxidase